MTTHRFIVWSLRAMVAGFAATGLLFIATPDGVLDAIADAGDALGSFSESPATDQKLWLGLGFSYMIVIAAVALVAQADVVRFRPLLLVLALGKTASSLSGLGFYLFDDEVFAYLLNFVVDGLLVVAALYLWRLAGKVAESSAPG